MIVTRFAAHRRSATLPCRVLVGRALVPLVAIAALTVLSSGCASGAANGGTDADRSGQVDALFARYTDGVQPGVAVMVVHDGRVVHEAGYGYADLENATPLAPNTSVRLGSVTKQFVCMAIMLLAEHGQLDYDDPVSKHVPEISARYGDEITVRHLMNHTGGLPDYYPPLRKHVSGRPPNNEDGAEVYASWGEPAFAPGDRYEYSNSGYEVLALVAQRVADEPFSDFVATDIFEPLAMSGAIAWDDPDKVIPNRAFGYSPVDDAFELNDDHRMNFMMGAGGIYASLQDMYRWDQALYTEKLVSQSTLDEAFTPALNNRFEDIGYGFGWRVGAYEGHRRISHGGSWVGFRTAIARHPDAHLSIVLLSNRADFDSGEFIDPITDIYLDPLPAADRVDNVVGFMNEGSQPGTAVLVAKDGEILHSDGYGLADVAAGTAVSADTNFRLGSVSKQFVAMAVMILAQDGKLSLEDSVADHLPELRRFSNVTIRHLLVHTGGLPEYYDEIERRFAGLRPGNEEAVAVFADWGEALFDPGERHQYSNPGYDTLAALVERVSGQSFSEFVGERIFEPLEMDRSFVPAYAGTWPPGPDDTLPQISNRAIGHARSDDGFEIHDDHMLNSIVVAGGVFSTVEDLLRWDQALYTDRLVDQAALEEAFTSGALNDGSTFGYGFGWGIGSHRGHRRISHGGAWVGFRTAIARYPDIRLTVIVLTNLTTRDPNRLADEIAVSFFESTD